MLGDLDRKPLGKDAKKLTEEQKLPEKMSDLKVQTNPDKSSDKLPGLAAFDSDCSKDL